MVKRAQGLFLEGFSDGEIHVHSIHHTVRTRRIFGIPRRPADSVTALGKLTRGKPSVPEIMNSQLLTVQTGLKELPPGPQI